MKRDYDTIRVQVKKGGISKNMQNWFKVWIRPRQVVADELKTAREKKQTWNYLLIAYVSAVLSTFTNFSSGVVPTFVYVIVFALLTSIVVAPISLYVLSWLYKWVGSWLGGKGTALDLRVATVHTSMIPLIIHGLISIPFILVIGETYYWFDLESILLGIEIALSPLQLWAQNILGLISLTAGIWTFVLLMHGIGEAHQFSAWKSVLVVLILGAMLVVIAVVVSFLLAIVGAL
ncbi:Yip1 domain-containing protein [Shouchella rhizosphaerae]|nr:Yip1 domain-containing protein [Shouchella rhizosphaerae]